ncbi:MAG: V-type ATP synthase subunit I [Zhaonellaceae bacterium]|jgi:V/A-type H+-transporting ATPase subunit I
MAIVKMNKITLLSLEKDKQQIIDTLMKLGVVEISTLHTEELDEEVAKLIVNDGDEQRVAEIEDNMAKIKAAIDYLGKYDTRTKGLFEPKRQIDLEQYQEIVSNEQAIWQVVEQINQLDEQLVTLRAEQNRTENLIGSLAPWKDLDIPIDTPSTRNVTYLTGTIPALVDMKKLEEELCTTVPESYLKVVNSDRDQRYVFVAYLNKREDEAMNLLKGYGFSKVVFKDLSGTFAENIAKAEQNLQYIEKQRAEVKKRIASFAGEIENLEVLHDHYEIQRDRTKVLERLIKTDKTFMLEGWLPAEESEKVRQQILKKYDCLLEIGKPEKDEQHPILLKNHPLVEPFEIITELYSLPNSNEVDPNPVMAPFFFLFFGLMIGDAAYGLIMTLATGVVIKMFKPEGMAGKLLKMIFLGGISTFFWGALFGSWLGDLVFVVTGGAYTIPPIWFNPLENPLQLLFFSFILGALHIFVGMGVKGYMLIKDGKPLDALFDIVSWYLLIPGLAAMAAGGVVGTIGKYTALAGALMLLLTQGRNEKNIIKRLMGGLSSLYGITGYFSDILSYSRLLALGLATGVIASVINTMGTLFGINILGIIILLIVLVIGTVFNIAINALGAYVHASRLQYVEFFGKFYEGGGKPFEPFKINTKFTKIN